MAQERLSQLQKGILKSLLWTKKFRAENPVIDASEDFINRNKAESVRIAISQSLLLTLRAGPSLSVSFSRSIRNLERKNLVTLRYMDNKVDTIGLTEEGQALAESLNVKA